MKKVFCLALMVFAAIMLVGIGVAIAGDKKDTNEPGTSVKKIAFKTMYDVVYEINLPIDINSASVAKNVDEGVWYCDTDQTVPVKEQNIHFSYAQNVPDLNQWNISRVGLSGMNYSNETVNLNEYLRFDANKKIVQVNFANQYCEQKVTSQNYDWETQKWTCTVSSTMDCDDVSFDLSGKVYLTVVPYIFVK
jgi:hypothetical protein